MNNSIISIETAKLAKEVGFDEVCDYAYCLNLLENAYYLDYDHSYHKNSTLYEHHYAAPTYEELHAWLRSKNVFITITVDQTLEPKFAYEISKYDPNTSQWVIGMEDKNGIYSDLYYKYESALNDAIIDGLKLI